MKTFNKTLLAALLTMAFVGTSHADDNAIGAVKDYVYKNIDQTLTVGKALDTRKMCKDVSWSTFTDDRERSVVNYSCELTGYDEYFAQWDKERMERTFSSQYSKLKSLQRRLDSELSAKHQTELYFKFMEEMKQKNVLSTFISVKEQLPKNVKMLMFVYDQSEAGAKERGVPEKDIPAFLEASRIYTAAVDSEEYGDLFKSSMYEIMFEQILTLGNKNMSPDASCKTSNQGDCVKASAMDKNLALQLLILANGYSHIDSINDEINFVKRKLKNAQASKEKEDINIDDVQINQDVQFVLTDKGPVVMNCSINLYNSNGDYSEGIDNNTLCLKEIYQSTFDKFYTNTLKKLYTQQYAPSK